MKVTTRDLGDREVELTIEVDSERVNGAMRAVARKYARETNIPGFRPGKAPYSIVAQRVGQERLVQEALEQVGSQIYQEAIEEADIEPYEFKPLEIDRFEPLTLSVTLPLQPKIELGDYSHIRVEAPEVEVTEEDIQAILREYQEEDAQLVPVDRPAELGDQVIVDLRIEVGGEVVYNRQNISFVLSPEGLTGVPEAFFEEVAGMAPVEERTFQLAYPEDFGDADLAGQLGTFRVKLYEVKERELPALDDELAQTVGDFDTLEELHERTHEVLLQRAQTEAENELAETVLEQVTAMATFEYPSEALEDEIDLMISELETRAEDRGLSLENYMLLQGVTEDELRDEYRGEAESRLKRRAVLTEVVQREGVEVSDEEIDKEIDTIAGMYGARASEVRSSLSTLESRNSLGSRLLAQKALDYLVAVATGEAEDGEPGFGPVSEIDAGDLAGDTEAIQVEDVENET